MPKPWLRLYRSTLHNAKAQRLKPELFRLWINLLCTTDDNGNLPPIADLAWALRTTETKAAEAVAALIEAGLFDQIDGATAAHDWDEHNYPSDGDPTARDRKRRQRARSRVTSTVTHQNGHADVTRTEQNRAEQNRADRESAREDAPPPRPIGRIAWTQEVPDQWHVTAAGQLKSLGLEPIETNTLAAKFTAHYRATGETRTISEWQARFIKWAIDEARKPNGTAQRQSGKPERKSASSIFLELGNGTRAAE